MHTILSRPTCILILIYLWLILMYFELDARTLCYSVSSVCLLPLQRLLFGVCILTLSNDRPEAVIMLAQPVHPLMITNPHHPLPLPATLLRRQTTSK